MDFLIVGSGFFGATFARLATDSGKKVMVIDKSPYLGGAASDSKWNNGIIVANHGGHILHTNSDEIWSFLCQFSEIIPFINKPKVLSDNNVYSFPINMMTLHQMWGVVQPEHARSKLESVRIPCTNPRNFEEWALDKVGRELYEKFIYGYTKKQWLKEPRELPSSIIQRLPIRLTYEENYFTSKYQGIPKNGYSELIKNMLTGIPVELGVDFFKMNHNAKQVVYTGPIDQFFNYEFGELEYNTLKFEHKIFQGDYQGNAVFNHVDLATPYLRSVEHKHFYSQPPKHYMEESEKETVVSFDYPISFKEHPEPYYPIRDEKNSQLYNKYKKLIDSSMLVGGRLGNYVYCDIDQTVAQAMNLAKKVL